MMTYFMVLQAIN